MKTIDQHSHDIQKLKEEIKELKNNQYALEIQKLKEEVKKLSEASKYHKIYVNHFSYFNNPNDIPKLLEDIIDDGQRNYRLKKGISSCPEFANPFLIKTWKFGYKSARMKLSVKEALDKFLNQLI